MPLPISLKAASRKDLFSDNCLAIASPMFSGSFCSLGMPENFLSLLTSVVLPNKFCAVLGSRARLVAAEATLDRTLFLSVPSKLTSKTPSGVR